MEKEIILEHLAELKELKARLHEDYKTESKELFDIESKVDHVLITVDKIIDLLTEMSKEE